MSHATRYVLSFLLTSSLVFSGAPVVAQETEEPSYTFVSMPDFLNADIGDAREARRWNQGDPNSINRSYRRAIDLVLDEVDAENPDSVLVAGDLVEGHWGTDLDDTRIFGRVNTFERRRRALERAGNLYYSQWQRRFDARLLTVFPAVGDHEIGDNPWPSKKKNRYNGYLPSNYKWRLVPTFKAVWADHFTDSGQRFPARPVGTPWEDTAYATYLTPDLLLVTVDVFQRISERVVANVTGGQLAWLDGLLATTAAKHVIVQGHTPVLGPVRKAHSTGIMLEGGAESPFWRTLVRHDVDAYLAGEVHEFTAIDDGVLQIAHGALLPVGGNGYNYVVGRIYEDRIELEVKRIDRTGHNNLRRLWQTSSRRPPISVSYARGTRLTGTATVTDEATTLEGEFEPWSGIEGE